MSLKKAYTERYNTLLVRMAEQLQDFLVSTLDGIERIDRINTRAKSVGRFCQKATTKKEDGSRKYLEPLAEIQDQIGARIVVFYPQDVEIVAERIAEFFHAIETKEMAPESDHAFGYIGRHFILPVLSDFSLSENPDETPEHFELQIKTMFQHAWSEASHDLAYKTQHGPLDSEHRRMIAYAAAQSWGADRIFEDIADGRIFENLKQIT